MDTKKEMSKSKEQLEEEKTIALNMRVKPLDLDGLDSDQLKKKVICTALWSSWRLTSMT